jgi:hypothetical protein
MSYKNQSWYGLSPEAALRIVKDESLDGDIVEVPSSQTNDIDYRIIDPVTDTKYHNSSGKLSSKKSHTENNIQQNKPVINKGKLVVLFILV